MTSIRSSTRASTRANPSTQTSFDPDITLRTARLVGHSPQPPLLSRSSDLVHPGRTSTRYCFDPPHLDPLDVRAQGAQGAQGALCATADPDPASARSPSGDRQHLDPLPEHRTHDVPPATPAEAGWPVRTDLDSGERCHAAVPTCHTLASLLRSCADPRERPGPGSSRTRALR